MKYKELIIVIGSFLLSSSVLANQEQIKMDCQEMAKKLCGKNCIQPEEPGTGDYPEWWSQEMKNKEWNKRVELKKQAKKYEDALKNQTDYVDYCIAKESDIKLQPSLNKMVHRQVIQHENVFNSWNQYRINEIKNNVLIFNVIEQDRKIYNRRYDYYKKHQYEKVRKSLESFVDETYIAKRLHLLDMKQKHVEMQNEFLTYIASDLNIFTYFMEVKAKYEKQKNLLDTSDYREVTYMEITKSQEDVLKKYLITVEKKSPDSMINLHEKYKIKIVESE